MKQKLFLMWTAVVLLLMSFTAQAENVITMTTSNAVGSNLQLNIEATGAVTIDGATGTYKSGEDVTYTTTAQTITITGDVTYLNCGSNGLTALDVSHNTALTELYCYDNQLTALDVSKNTALKVLSCDGNQLTALDVSKNTALTDLCCDNNSQLPALNVTKNTALKVLHCYYTKITELDVTKNTALEELWCFGTLITVLDVSKNTALAELYCEDNQLTALDVSLNTALTNLDCGNNKLTALDVSENTALGLLYCEDNQLTTLDVSKNTTLKELRCYGNQLTALDVSKNTALKELWCYGNQFKGAVMDALIASLVDCTGTGEAGKFVVVSDLETDANRNTCTTAQVAAAKAKNWTSYNIDTDRKLAEYAGYTPSTNVITMTTSKAVGSSLKLNIEATGAVTIDGATGTYKSGEDVTYTLTKQTITIMGDVTSLNCGSNKLTALDVSKNTALKVLDCNNNQLTALDVSENTALIESYCYNNQLTTLDVAKLTALDVLSCDGNQLTALDVSKNTALTYLYCYDNQLTALDVSKNTALIELWCYGNQLTALDLSKNTALSVLRCFGNQFKGAVMDALIASLVDRTGAEKAGKFVVVSDMETDANRNTCTTTQVAAAKAKNWTSYNSDTDWNLTEYAGYTPSTNVITMTTSKAVGSSLVLYIRATGAVTIDGATGTYESGKTVTYTTTAQTITITGDVTSLDCGSNKLTALDVSKNTALAELYCYDNQLTALDVSKNTALTVLDCGSNKLTVLDVNNNTALTELICYDNQLTVLDVSKNTVLTYLDCSGNQLTALDVSKNTALTKLWCFGNQFKGAVMDVLIASLVDRTGAEEAGQFVVVSDLETDANRNTCTTTQVAAAKAKNWTSYNWDNADRELAEYAGSEPNVIEGVQRGDDATPTAIYDVSGRRIGQMQRGINIVKMRNGRTRKVMK